MGQFTISQTSTKGEWTAWIVGILTYMALMRDALLEGVVTFGHDAVHWNLPGYHFWANSLLQGRWPFWNPFTHGGEPFYPLLIHLRLLDPNGILFLALGGIFTDDLVLLYNWDRCLRGLIIAVGAYLLIRRWADHLVTRWALMLLVLFSSFQLVGYRQHGFFDLFLWAPWILIALCRIVVEGDCRWRWWLLLGLLLGLNWQSFFFVGVWTLVLLFLAGIVIFRRDLLRQMYCQSKIWFKIGSTGLIVSLLILPNAVLLFEKDRFLHPLRMPDLTRLPPGHRNGGPLPYEPKAGIVEQPQVLMSYSMIEQFGTASSPFDFLQLIMPFGNWWISRGGSWGRSSEAFMYFGILGYAGSVYGVIAGRHHLKRVWLLIGCTFGLLMLGPDGLLHRLLYPVFPPLWFVRHTHLFVLFFSLALLYFFVIGCNRLLSHDESSSPPLRTDRLRVFLGVLNRMFSFPKPWAGGSLIAIGLILNRHNVDALRSTFPGHVSDVVGVVSSVLSIQVACIATGLAILLWSGRALVKLQRTNELLGARLSISVFVLLVIGGVSIFSSNLPVDWLKGPLILVIGLLVWKAKASVGESRMFWVVMVAHVFVVLIVGQSLWTHLPTLMVFAGAPLAILYAAIRSDWLTLRGLHLMLLACLVVDLAYYGIRVTEKAYVDRPDSILDYEARPQEPRMSNRRVFPPCSGRMEQSLCLGSSPSVRAFDFEIGYSEALFRTPVVFNPLYWPAGAKEWRKVVLSPENEIRLGLESDRAGAFLMPRSYFALVTGGVDPSALRDMFAVGRSPVQSKDKGLVLDDSSAIERLRNQTSDLRIDLERTAVISRSAEDASDAVAANKFSWGGGESDGRADRASFEVRSMQYNYDSLSLGLRTNGAEILYWADGFDPHWRAYVDGLEVPVLRANIHFKAVRLPGGDHRVDFVYDHIWFKRALVVFALTVCAVLVLLMGCAVADWRRGGQHDSA